MDRVRRIEIYRLRLPLREALHHSRVNTAYLDQLFAVLETEEGVTGYGEVRGNGAYATGADTGELIHGLSRCASQLSGCPLHELSRRVMELTALPAAAALVEGAALDAAARAAGVPVWRWLGLAETRPLSTHAHIGFAAPDHAARLARRAAAHGVHRFKVRVGSPDLADDVARVGAVRDAIGETAEIAVDANGAWSAAQAEEAMRALASFRLLWVEQPTPAGDDEALRRVRRASPVPVVLDEIARSVADVERIAREQLADGINIKLEKFGTAADVLRAADLARDAGLLVEVGQMDQGRLGCALTAHLAAAARAEYCELWGFQNVAEDAASGLDLVAGCIHLTGAPGLGVQVRLRGAERVMTLC